MDSTDRKILALLQQNARMTVKELAGRVSLSAPSVAARIQKMEESGVIAGYHAVINTEMAGYPIRAFIQVQVKVKRRADFFKHVKRRREVVACHCITGDYDMLIEGVFPRTRDISSFVESLQEFGETKTYIVFSEIIEHRGLQIETDETD
ncbi:Lrp/AsnC family transcriptional regulator [Mediterraneibacter glycyrrhizinilyticus]|uniref:Lrp/AsnC family transcriptional regulator n=1 Tax=Mediterraneibacter glycyrrhizinilyticus TaxID=342942 RepID=UPI00196157DA|nr:Lrp/AsnC family transcriptional regulator [Mediterraneibacter glycyrrhizinilyticus]MBM6752377.1 Lrp/AsnC family transcriptional regulator [Mediterraneibacter glycyrrhizinilyticus]